MKPKVVILGSGVIGILTAYFLNKKGFEVQVVERRVGSCLGASFANGSQISFSHVMPLNFKEATSWFKKGSGSIRVEKTPEVAEFFAKHKQMAPKFEENAARLAELAKTSEEALAEILRTEDIARYIKSCGIIHYFSSSKEMEKKADLARKAGMNFSVMTKQNLFELEPNLSLFQSGISGGLYFEGDKTSNCYDLSMIFERMLRERGVQFAFKTGIKDFEVRGNKIVAAIAEDGARIEGDIFVACAGMGTNELLAPLSLKFEIFGVRGYSMTFNMEKSNYTPFIGLIDNKKRLFFSLYKNYLRVGGFFDFGVNSKDAINERLAEFEASILDSFPILKRNLVVHKWSEERPVTPNSLPIIGRDSSFENLLINAGHGSFGFTLSFGSGAIISELL